MLVETDIKRTVMFSGYVYPAALAPVNETDVKSLFAVLTVVVLNQLFRR